MIRADHLLKHVIKPTLDYLEMDSLNARALLLGTAAVESHLGEFLVQVKGPALGIYQMEPATHDDIWRNWLGYRWFMRKKLLDMVPERMRHGSGTPPADAVIGNLCYATAMARQHYMRVPAPIPAFDNVVELAHYWKDHYNTHKGRGTIESFVENFERRVLPSIKASEHGFR